MKSTRSLYTDAPSEDVCADIYGPVNMFNLKKLKFKYVLVIRHRHS